MIEILLVPILVAVAIATLVTYLVRRASWAAHQSDPPDPAGDALFDAARTVLVFLGVFVVIAVGMLFLRLPIGRI